MNRFRLLILAAAAAGLTACAHGPARVETVYQTVEKPVPVTCVPQRVGPTPQGLETPQTLAAIPEGPQRYTRLAADWLLRYARMAVTEPTVDSCRTAPPARASP